jgi:hypothetical protein
VSTVTWTDFARACTPVQLPTPGTCKGGDLCLPAPAQPFPPRFCVLHTGVANSCPGTAYTDGPHIYYSDQVTDTRACSACSCGPVAGGGCRLPSIAGFPYLDTVCAVPGAGPFAVPTPCLPILTAKGFKLSTSPTVTDGGCAPDPSGGQPTGRATPTAPTTLCCTP